MATNRDKNFVNQVDLLDIIIGRETDDKMLRFFNQMLRYNYNPDINGYTLLFMVPPDLSGLREEQDHPEARVDLAKSFPGIEDGSLKTALLNTCKFITFAAVDFSPPQEQLNTEKISSRSGAIPYATEFTTSEQLSVTYIDDSDLTIYKFHQLWIHYIWDTLEGKIKPHSSYLNPELRYDTLGSEGGYYGAIDYGASIYIVKYRPDLRYITYIGKCIGVFPQSLPSKELIGQRTTNELTTLPFNYFCSAYRSEVTTEIIDQRVYDREKFWIMNEFQEYVLTKF